MMENSNKTVFFFLGSLKVGGTEVVAMRLQKKLSEKGYKIFYILLKDKVELPVECPPEMILNLKTENYRWDFFKVLFSIIGLWKYYQEYRPQRIVSFSSGLNVLLLVSFLPNLILTIDTNLFAVKSNLYRRWVLKYIGYFSNVKKVIVPSNGLRLAFKEYLPEKSYRKLITVFNPVEKIIINYKDPFPENEVSLVSIGRITKSKGFEQLIKCFAEAKFHTEVKLYLIGSGPIEEEIIQMINQLGVRDKIKMLGFQKFPGKYLKYADGLILNSDFESFGNVLIEALFLNIPVLSNDCDFGPREIITHKINGLLYDNSKDEHLVEVLEYFVNNEEIRSSLKENTSSGLERFNPDNIHRKWGEEIL